MNLGPSEVTDSDGAVVISITVARRWGQSPRTKCQHVRTHADEELAELHCLDCNEKLNPVWWIIRLADHWRHVEANRRAAIHEQERAQARTRMRCDCGKWVRFYSSTTDEKARKATREGRYEDALQRIANLTPEAAAKHAAEEARKALTARDETPPQKLAVVPASSWDAGKGDGT